MTTALDLDFSHIRNLTTVLSSTPSGQAIVDLGTKLGLWSKSLHATPDERRPFKTNLGNLGPTEISNELGHWTSEFGRLAELNGLLVGQRDQLKIKGKRLRASARTRIRQARKPDDKPLTASALNDEAEDDRGVLDNDEHQVLVEALLAFVQGTKEATAQYLQSLSREIAYRDAQMKARMYG